MCCSKQDEEARVLNRRCLKCIISSKSLNLKGREILIQINKSQQIIVKLIKKGIKITFQAIDITITSGISRALHGEQFFF